MATERRNSPRQKIKEIKRIGKWGDVAYHHVLSCGHVEVRKRAASTSEIACTWCLRAREKDKEIKALTKISFLQTEDQALADDEVRIERKRAALASRFGVPVDAVDIASEDISGKLIIRSATIYLSARDVDNLTSSN